MSMTSESLSISLKTLLKFAWVLMLIFETLPQNFLASRQSRSIFESILYWTVSKYILSVVILKRIRDFRSSSFSIALSRLTTRIESSWVKSLKRAHC